MKKALVIIFGIVLLGIGAYVAWSLGQETPEPAPYEPIDFPISDPGQTGTRSTVSIAGQRGTVVVNEFLDDPDVVEDVANPGYYFLGNAPAEPDEPTDAPYEIVYLPDTSYFNVVLLKEPIGETRLAAEQYLIAKLGISQAEMCNLVYTVSVPAYVNPIYTSMSLGFSFCPDAVKLP